MDMVELIPWATPIRTLQNNNTEMLVVPNANAVIPPIKPQINPKMTMFFFGSLIESGPDANANTTAIRDGMVKTI